MEPIITIDHPNKDVLYKHTTPITTLDIIDRQELMIDYCKVNNLKGLALPQIGISKSGFVAYVGGEYRIYINPKILKKSNLTIKMTEGCASLPGFFCLVERPYIIMVEYLNKSFVKQQEILLYPASQVFMHEYDHLNGIVLDSLQK